MSSSRQASAIALTLAMVLGRAPSAQATPLFSVSGRVDSEGLPLPSGVTVRLEVDLNRDGQFARFEQLTGTVDASGNYRLTYDLPQPTNLSSLEETVQFGTFVGQVLAGFSSRGFDYLLDQGPLAVVLTFEREGYSTVVRRLNTMWDSPSLEAILTPLQGVGCSPTGCQSGSGNLTVSGFPGGTGIARAYAEAYDPSLDTSRFPGGFVENGGSLLISSGFMEVDFRDQNGSRVKSLSKAVDVRFEANRASWSTLRDLAPGTSGIEVPMWSFDEKIAQWVAEQDGELLDANGAPIPEANLAAIQTKSYPSKVFVGFRTQHFSSWNCDHPVTEHTCVKGRLVEAVSGTALAGVTVSAPGVSYTGSSGSMTTGVDGYFVADLMRSEKAGEDVDRNGKTGETFTAQLSVSGGLGIYKGAPFATSIENRVMSSRGSPNCRPSACNCPDLGDVKVEFETPRLCQITVHGTYSGQGVTDQDPGASDAGDPLAGALVRAHLLGTEVPPAAAAAVCTGKICNSGTYDAQGNVTILVPVVGDFPQIDVTSDVNQGTDYYSAEASVVGCDAGETAVAGAVELSYSHTSLAAIGSYIASLGIESKDGGLPTRSDALKDVAKNCGCRIAGDRSGALSYAALVVVGLAVARRRRMQPTR